MWDCSLDCLVRFILRFRIMGRTSKPLVHGSVLGISRITASIEPISINDGRNDKSNDLTYLTDMTAPTYSVFKRTAQDATSGRIPLPEAAHAPVLAPSRPVSGQATTNDRLTHKTSSSPLTSAHVQAPALDAREHTQTTPLLSLITSPATCRAAVRHRAATEDHTITSILQQLIELISEHRERNPSAPAPRPGSPRLILAASHPGRRRSRAMGDS